jgi:hypothetical protein
MKQKIKDTTPDDLGKPKISDDLVKSPKFTDDVAKPA